MRKLLFISTIFLTLHATAQPPTKGAVEIALDNLINDPSMQAGEVGFIAMNLSNGKVIVDHYGQKSMVPASIQKAVTTAVAMEKLGPDFQFKTTFSAAGDLESKMIYGDIYVFPSGDPTLQSRYYEANPSTIARIKEELAKYPSFDGNLVIDASVFNKYNTPRGWIWEDMGNYFGSSPTALMWKDNLLEVYINTGQAGSAAMLSNKTEALDGFDLDIQVTASQENKDNAWFFGAPGSDVIYAKGTIPSHRTNFLVKAAHPDPMKRFGMDVMKAIGKQPKVKVDYEYIPHNELNPIFTLHSPPLSSIVRICNQNSINLYAEALNMQLDTAQRYKSVEGGVAMMEHYLKSKQISMKGTRLADGSGLSPTNRMTCQTMIEVLFMMYRSKNKDAYMNSFPIAGKNGTMSGYFQNTVAEGNIKAKSGSMAGVRNFAGYLTNTQGETVAFCLMVNDFDESKKSTIIKKMEDLLISVIEN
ncbi:MAG: D-alanyl-D-alanine carboxypeptidase/D-alanyl-D-alanine-endopeptidase [Flavobacteriales bacterium]